MPHGRPPAFAGRSVGECTGCLPLPGRLCLLPAAAPAVAGCRCPARRCCRGPCPAGGCPVGAGSAAVPFRRWLSVPVPSVPVPPVFRRCRGPWPPVSRPGSVLAGRWCPVPVPCRAGVAVSCRSRSVPVPLPSPVGIVWIRLLIDVTRIRCRWCGAGSLRGPIPRSTLETQRRNPFPSPSPTSTGTVSGRACHRPAAPMSPRLTSTRAAPAVCRCPWRCPVPVVLPRLMSTRASAVPVPWRLPVPALPRFDVDEGVGGGAVACGGSGAGVAEVDVDEGGGGGAGPVAVPVPVSPRFTSTTASAVVPVPVVLPRLTSTRAAAVVPYLLGRLRCCRG